MVLDVIPSKTSGAERKKAVQTLKDEVGERIFKNATAKSYVSKSISLRVYALEQGKVFERIRFDDIQKKRQEEKAAKAKEQETSEAQAKEQEKNEQAEKAAAAEAQRVENEKKAKAIEAAAAIAAEEAAQRARSNVIQMPDRVAAASPETSHIQTPDGSLFQVAAGGRP